MRSAVRQHVESLPGFPLDPDAGAAWLWSAHDARLMWRSADADAEAADGRQPDLHDLLRGLAPDLARPEPEREPVRVQQLGMGGGSPLTSLCRVVRLRSGGLGLLAVAVAARKPAPVEEPGASASVTRSLNERVAPFPSLDEAAVTQEAGDDTDAEMRDEVAITVSKEAVDEASDALAIAEPQDNEVTAKEAAALPAAAVGEPENRQVEPEAAPTIKPAVQETQAVEEPADPAPTAPPRKSVQHTSRFVWQTDSAGRFVHLSHELADAVGRSNAELLGLDWATVVAKLGIGQAEAVGEAFATRASWTAGPVLWPSALAREPVPIELGGVVVRENGVFAGYRGYGMARVRQMSPATPASIRENSEDNLPGAGDNAAAVYSQGHGPSSGVSSSAGEPATTPPRRRPLPILEATPPTVLGLRTLLSENHKKAQPKRLLSDQERDAFREIARALDAGKLPIEDIDAAAASAEDEASLAEPQASEGLASPLVSYEALAERRARRKPGPAGDERLVQLLDRLPVALAVTQAGRLVHVNRGMLGLTGYSDLAAFASAGGVEELFLQNPAGDQEVANAFLIRTKDGAELKVDACLQQIDWRSEPATLIALVPQAAAIATPSQQRALELDLIAARAEMLELQAVLDTATDGIITLDSEGRILGMNRSAEALFGYDQREVTGEPLTTLLDPRSHNAALDYLEGLKSNGVASLLNDGREVEGRERKNGSIPLFMTLGRLNDIGPRGRFCAVLKDMSAWKKAERELEDARRKAESANANKTDFLASVSHELRTPLNAIIGFSEAIVTEQFGPVGNDRYRQYARDIHDSGAHVLSLVNDLLDLSKIAAGKFELTFERVDINAIVASAAAMLEPQANRARVVIRTQLAQGLPAVVADPRSIRQIVLNLLSNATRYTKPGGHAIVSTSLSGAGEAVIRIRDTGVGMTPTEVAHAMEPFRQIGGAHVEGGTGLGLPLTKALVEANRAQFRIESTRGEGTLTEVVFPATRVLAE